MNKTNIKEINELKKSNEKLVKTIQSLKQEIKSLENRINNKENEKGKDNKPESSPLSKCEKCGEHTKIVDLGQVTIRLCPNCKWHIKEKTI